MSKPFADKKRAKGLLAAAIGVAVLVFANGLGLAQGSGKPQVKKKVTAERRSIPHVEAKSPAAVVADRIPARVLGPDVPVPISPMILQATNGWLVSDGTTLVAVYAGASGDDASQGRLVVVRQDLVQGIQTIDVVNAGKTGVLTIASPPSGAAVETTAQRGDIAFHGVSGAVGVLHLTNDSIDVH